MPSTEALIRQAIQADLPEFNRLRHEARELAGQVTIGRTAFLHQHGLASELEYKQQAMRDRQIMYHAHIGMNDMDTTAAAISAIHEQLAARGFNLDRAGYALDRRMGLPPDKRAGVAAETGPMLER